MASFRVHLAFAALLALLAPAAAQAPQPAPPAFVLPIACVIGKSCFVQNYVDTDPTPGAKDFTCGTRTYEGHNGTDIRLPTLEDQKRGVAVLSAAAGKVLRLRDGEPDVSVRERGVENLDGKDCGNGVVIDHGGGWQTQYCHMARNSIVVREGEAVRAGQPIGMVGLSGRTEYPHVHFTVRQGNRVVDPFAVDATPGTCGLARQSAWAPTVRDALAYQPRAVLNAGFAPAVVSMEAVEAGEAGRVRPDGQAPAIVAFVRAIGLKAGDVQRLVVTAPDGSEFARGDWPALARPQAQTLAFAGRKRPPAGYPPGVYTVRYDVRDGTAVVLTHELTLRLGS